jgi:hypothetical protein
MKEAQELLIKALEVMAERAKERGLTHERSMPRAVAAFNFLTSNTLSESEGLLFMVCLKLARSGHGKYHEDDIIDALAYLSLYGEARKSLEL